MRITDLSRLPEGVAVHLADGRVGRITKRYEPYGAVRISIDDGRCTIVSCRNLELDETGQRLIEVTGATRGRSHRD